MIYYYLSKPTCKNLWWVSCKTRLGVRKLTTFQWKDSGVILTDRRRNCRRSASSDLSMEFYGCVYTENLWIRMKQPEQTRNKQVTYHVWNHPPATIVGWVLTAMTLIIMEAIEVDLRELTFSKLQWPTSNNVIIAIYFHLQTCEIICWLVLSCLHRIRSYHPKWYDWKLKNTLTETSNPSFIFGYYPP